MAPAVGIGYDEIWLTVMCTIGLIRPPTGTTASVIRAPHSEIPVARIYPRHAAVPDRGSLVLVALLIAMPALAFWPPACLQM